MLLFRNSYQSKWALPGGWLKKGEHIYRGIEREMKEEVNLEVEVIRVLETKNVEVKPVIDIAVECEVKGGTVKPDGVEVLEAKFFSYDELPAEIMSTHKPYIEAFIKAKRSKGQKDVLEVSKLG